MSAITTPSAVERALDSGRWASLMVALGETAIFPTAVHRVLLYGPPGTGKSSIAYSMFPSTAIERVTLHDQVDPSDLIGTWKVTARNGGTDMEWVDGPAVRAMKSGSPLILDEVDSMSPEVKNILHAILDDRAIASLHLPNGTIVKPTPGFCVIGTTNRSPDDLPEAIRDRFDLTLRADTPAPGILSSLPEDMAAMLVATYRNTTTKQWSPCVSARSMLAFSRLTEAIGDRSMAARLVFNKSATDFLNALSAHA